MKLHQDQKGFTLLELLIATTVFSTILLLCTFGLIQIGNTFYKGSTAVRTQNVARSALDGVSQAIQYGGRGISTDPGGSQTNVVPASGHDNGAFCTGDVRYRYNKNTEVRGTNWALVVDTDPTGSCDYDASKGFGKELLGEGMRLADFSITNTGANYDIKMSVAYGDSDQLISGTCKPGAGSQFCAVSTFNTTVQRRIQ